MTSQWKKHIYLQNIKHSHLKKLMKMHNSAVQPFHKIPGCAVHMALFASRNLLHWFSFLFLLSKVKFFFRKFFGSIRRRQQEKQQVVKALFCLLLQIMAVVGTWTCVAKKVCLRSALQQLKPQSEIKSHVPLAIRLFNLTRKIKFEIKKENLHQLDNLGKSLSFISAFSLF